MKFIYPAVFRKTDKGTYRGFFPDLEDCYGEGDTLDEAIEEANAAAYNWITLELDEDDCQLPPVSDEDDLELQDGDIVRNISVNIRFYDVGMNDHSNLFCSGNIYQNYRYRWNVDSIPPVFLYYDIFRNIATANFYFSFTAFSAVFGVPVSPLPSLPKVQGFRQILQAVYCLRSSDWMLFSHCVIQPSYCRPVFPAPLSLF